MVWRPGTVFPKDAELVTSLPTVNFEVSPFVIYVCKVFFQISNCKKYLNTLVCSVFEPSKLVLKVRADLSRLFSEWSSIPAPFNTNTAQIDSLSLPHVIQRDCLQWECALRAEIFVSQNRHHWLSNPLECKNVSVTKRNTKLFLSTENVSFFS